MAKLGEDATEVLVYIPGRFQLIRYVRPKYACKRCGAISQAPAPARRSCVAARPSCSPPSRPLRVAFGDSLRPALTQAARDDDGIEGRDGETALNRTEKYRQDGPDGNRGLYF